MTRHPSELPRTGGVGADSDLAVGLRAALEPRPEDVERMLRDALATGSTPAAPVRSRPSRRPRRVLAAAALALLLAVAAGWMSRQPPRAPEPTPSRNTTPATLTLVGTGKSIAIQIPPGAAPRETTTESPATDRPPGSFLLLRRLDP